VHCEVGGIGHKRLAKACAVLAGPATLVLTFALLAAPSVSPAGAAGSTTITKCTTKAIEKAVEEGGTYTLACENPEIKAPTPEKKPKGGLAPGFKVASKKSVTFIAAPGTLPSFENDQERNSRIFTVPGGASLTLIGVTLSSTAAGPQGIAAGKAKTNGDKGAPGEAGEEPEEVEEGKEEIAKAGENATEGSNHTGEETSSAGGDGGRGTDGGLIGGKALNAPTVEGGAISNAGTVTLENDNLQGDFVEGGAGGQGGGGGSGGAGGAGGGAGSGTDKQQCGEQGEVTVEYLAVPPGAGGDGGRGGDGGPGTPAGNGGEAKGGAIYNTGTLTVKGSTFGLDVAIGGIGAEGGAGGGGAGGGSGGIGNPGGEGGAGGNAGNGAAAGSGANGRGGAIYNTGRVTLENTAFSEDEAEGGLGGSGGGAGSAGAGGGGALALPYQVCEGEVLKSKLQSGGDGGEGGMGAEGGAGGSGGSAEGGAIYNSGTLTLAGSANSFANNFVVAGAGATVEQCKEHGGPCPGKGSAAGEGGEGGVLGEPVGAKGNTGPGSGASGKPGFNGAALDESIFGPSSGAPPEETKTLNSTPPNSPSSSSSTTKSGGGGGGDDDDNGDDDAKVSVKGKTEVKESGSTIIIETGEVVSCPPGTGECTMIVSATTTEVKVPAGAPAEDSRADAVDAAHKLHSTKRKPLVVGHATITVPAGASAKVTFKLTSEGATLLRKHHHLHVTVAIAVTHTGQAPVKHTATITLQPPKPAGHRKRR
jgi:hypothetical protein